MSEAVIVAHGLWMPGLETKLFRHRLDAAGFESHSFRFPTMRATLGQNLRRLREFAEATPGDRIHFVGHSLGGVVVVSTLAEAPLERVGRIVCLGSPFRGSRPATRMMRTRVGRGIIGRCLSEHIDRGGLGHWDGRYELGIIAGTRALGLGIVVHRLSGPNDGMVCVDETELPGAAAHITLPVTHTQLLFDRATAKQAVHFLRHGRFEDQA